MTIHIRIDDGVAVRTYDEMIGKTAQYVSITKARRAMYFCMTDGSEYLFSYHHECHWGKGVEEIRGNLAHLLGSAFTGFEKAHGNPFAVGVDWYDKYAYTFYRFTTAKGSVIVSWHESRS